MSFSPELHSAGTAESNAVLTLAQPVTLTRSVSYTSSSCEFPPRKRHCEPRTVLTPPPSNRLASRPPPPATPPHSPPALVALPVPCLARPATPTSRSSSIDGVDSVSPLLRKENTIKMVFCNPDVALISAGTFASAIDFHYSRPLPEVDGVFPWMHGLHPHNIHQRAFLDPRKRYRDKSGVYFDLSQISEDLLNDDVGFQTPSNARGLVVVKVGDDDNLLGTLVGSVTPQEILCRKDGNDEWEFPFDAFNALNNKNNNDNDNDDDDCEGDDCDCDDNDNRNDNDAMDLDTHHHVDGTSQDTPEHSAIPFAARFLVLDPAEGISLRNFQIQVAKWATISDIAVYASNPKDHVRAASIARLISVAQRDFRNENTSMAEFRTFLCKDSIEDFLRIAPHVISVPPHKHMYDEDEIRLKNWDADFLFHERVEMSMMSSASQIGGSPGAVWLGNAVDFEAYVDMYHRSVSTGGVDESVRNRNWATFIECFEGPQLPPFQVLDQYIQEAASLIEGENVDKQLTLLSIQFPSSGSIPLSECNDEVFFAIVSLCKLLYLRSRVDYRDSKAGVLIYCNDGYTETSLLALAYIIYSTGVSAAQAWIDLHVKYNRPFFCFTMDVLVIIALERMLLEYSPAVPGSKFHDHRGAVYSKGPHLQMSSEIPPWFAKLDGSLPSKILPHMYLGSLSHAENPEMLVQLGIKRVLSVGETLSWMQYNVESHDQELSAREGVYLNPYEGIGKVMYMDNIQDDGVDALTHSLATCLEFLDEGYRAGEPTLVHCRVGVSRSATVCIAEVMKRLSVGLPRAYLFVRVRRLNVIIQPNLRFMYELVKWEELNRRNGEGWLREVDWHVLCREIAIMNKVYIA